MSRHLELNARFLEPEELAYEKRIRSDREPPQHVLLMSELGVVVHWIEKKTVDPVNIPHQLREDQLGPEIELCCEKLESLAEDVSTQFVGTGSFTGIEIEEVQKWASRLVHYDYRIRRIDMTTLDADVKAKSEKAQQRGSVARALVAGALAALEPAHERDSTIQTRSDSGAQSSTTDPLITAPAGSISADPNLNANANGREQSAPAFNSTMNGTNPDLSVDQSLYAANVELQKRADAETARRLQEYDICVGRIEELHADIIEEYCSPMSLKRPKEASKLMSRLLGLETVLKCLLGCASDAQFRKKIESEISRLLGDAYILYTNMVLHAQSTNTPMSNIPYPASWQAQRQTNALGAGAAPAVLPTAGNLATNSNHTPGIRANSTMHPTATNAVPQVSMPLLPFEQAINGITFNTTTPAFGINDTSLSRGMAQVTRNTQQNRGQVAFNSQPQIIGDSIAQSQGQVPPSTSSA